ncbi:Uncharacterized protein YP598_4492 (plasmid) [Yersinia pseudotuberculosis]|nr:Uncharacterized protein YP598_4492 [Yersinia pseudotuberculosis]
MAAAGQAVAGASCPVATCDLHMIWQINDAQGHKVDIWY